MRTNRLSLRGATRLELAILIATTTALASLGLWLFSDQSGSSERAAAIVNAETLLQAAASWKREHESNGCPSFSQLKQDRSVPDEARADDPWGGRFRIACGSDDVSVRSAGGDGQFKTDDDISVSAPWRS